ncbi:hypothetical protein E3O06_02210 [Cryobacterium glaciale]|uniref:Uncharacterized protein n=1 Tax=Cryobacterium glaciale TaxID=1259145 RepID=A0A4R8V4S8_9MICO|nr:hypothetical protein [Cryobacterium glaciale]TFB76215.1 hypothetical protein E3O06_02210 [Cryobacterium glaciale]
MPWWSWLLIWCMLALGLLAVLSWFTVALYRQVRGTLRALESLSDQVSAIDRDLSSATPPFAAAAFADATVLLHDVEQQRVERTHRRQLRRDALIVRGKLMRNAR